ncbi:hypothetical protein FRC01_004957, partial [Tulasnella sp. 417]
MTSLQEFVQQQVDSFMDDLFRAARERSSTLSSQAAKIKIFDTIEVTIRRRRNEYVSFNQLPTDIIHLIFGMTLSLNRIHDYELSLGGLEQHRRHLSNIRCVSSVWNAFLLSSPKYWCAINIAAPEKVVELTLARAQQTPLCLYSNQEEGGDPLSSFGHTNSVLLGKTTQIRSIRTSDKGAYDFAIRMLCGGLPDLRTLELKKATGWDEIDQALTLEHIGADLPEIRHLRAVGWYPNAEA